MFPLRQSCDRCHEQKVRCIRDRPAKTVPCARCTKAGSTCIYSIQHKPGRRLSSKAATQRLPSSVAKTPASLHPIPDDVVPCGESNPETHAQSEDRLPHEWLHELDTPSPSSNPMADDASCFCSTPLEPSLDPTQTHIEQLANLVIAIGRSVSTLSIPAGRPPLSASCPPFNDICASASSLIMITTQISQPDMRGNELDISMLELDAHLNPIPTFDDLPSYPPPDTPAASGPAVLPNPGTLLMIMACYQRLLEAFETICLFMQQRLHVMEMNTFIGLSAQHCWGGRSASSTSSPTTQQQPPPSDTLQFIMMIRLTSDLLSRLDHSLAPLVVAGSVENNNNSGGRGLSVIGLFRHDTISRAQSPSLSSTSSTTGSMTGRLSSSRGSSDQMSALVGDDENRMGSEVGDLGSTSNILVMKGGEQLRQQQSRLRVLIKVVKKLVRSQKV